MGMYSFGSGFLFGNRTDIPNQTPQLFGTLQDVSVEFSATTKNLYGQYGFPVLSARGQQKIQCKAKLGQISANLFNTLYFGGTANAGQTAIAVSEVASVPAVSPFTVTTVNAANFLADEGVYYAGTGLPLARVTGSPAAGQYAVSAGVYSFGSGDASAGVLISYTYTLTGAGQKITLLNPLIGQNPIFSAQLFTQVTGPQGVKKALLNLRACVGTKLSLATKIEDFTIPEFAFECFADASGTVFDWSFGEVS